MSVVINTGYQAETRKSRKLSLAAFSLYERQEFWRDQAAIASLNRSSKLHSRFVTLAIIAAGSR